MPEIHALEPVNLREAWADEARHFTPWLADHLELLGTELELDLQLVGQEVTLPGAGRVDILAEQAGTGDMVVIENQLGMSDESHFSRLLGYAANAEANILVWVAQGFTNYYCSILRWLNASDTIDVYAVKVNAYRVGDALAAGFQTVVEPPQAPPGTSSPARETMSTHYANFYRQLVAQLRRAGLQAVGKGGWRGRWRSFQSGYPHIVYATGLNEGKAQLFLSLEGADQLQIYHALTQYQAEIDAGLVGDAVWHQGDRNSSVMLETEAAAMGSEEDLENTRQWMADNLLRLQAVIQPHLDRAMGGQGVGEDNDPEEAE